MHKRYRQTSWLTLWVLLLSFPLLSHAQEAPGAITFVVKDQLTERPLVDVQITIEERETSSTQTLTTNAQGRIIVEQLDPGLYAVTIAKDGFVSLYEPSVRVITRKNIQLDFELREESIEVLQVRAERTNPFASASSTYLDREDLRSNVGGGGRFSIFAPNVISGAEFSPGGWEAAYGGRAASLLKLEVAGGNPSPSASFRYDLAGYEVGYDGPLGGTDEGTLLVSARRLDFGSLFETIEELDIGNPVLRDVIVKSVIPMNSKHTLEVLLMCNPPILSSSYS